MDSSLHTLHQNYDLYIFKFWNIDANSLGTGVSCAYSEAVYFMLVNQVKLYLYLIVGLHQKWNSSVDRRFPSLWIFIRKMKDEQSNIKVSAEAAHNGNLASLKERKYRQMGNKRSSDFGGNTATG